LLFFDDNPVLSHRSNLALFTLSVIVQADQSTLGYHWNKISATIAIAFHVLFISHH